MPITRLIKTLVMLLVIATVTANAQDAERRRFRDKPNWEQKKEALETVKLFKFVEFMGITKERALDIFPLANELDENLKLFMEGREDILKEMRDAMENSPNDEAELDKLFKKYQTHSTQAWQKFQSTLDKIDKKCTPTEKVKMLLFEAKFRREILRIMREFRGGRERRGDFNRHRRPFQPSPPDVPPPPIDDEAPQGE